MNSHLNLNYAKFLSKLISIENIQIFNNELVIAIPFNAPQGIWGGNIYETHLQPELTHESFLEKYVGFKPLEYRNDYGVYIKQ